MCSRARPLMGADSGQPDGYIDGNPFYADGSVDTTVVERPYRALVEDYDGTRYSLTVHAIGPKGAELTARQTAIDRGYDPATVLKVEAA